MKAILHRATAWKSLIDAVASEEVLRLNPCMHEELTVEVSTICRQNSIPDSDQVGYLASDTRKCGVLNREQEALLLETVEALG